MKIRDGHATLNGDTTEYPMPSGVVQIIADDGRTLLDIQVQQDGTFRISAGMHCKHGGKILEDNFEIIPIACNCIHLRRPICATR